MLFGDASGDPRPRRFIDLLLSKGYEVDVLGDDPYKALNVNRYITWKTANSTNEAMVRRLAIYLKRVLTILGPIGFINDFLNDVSNGVNGMRREFESAQYDVILVEHLYLIPFAKRIGKGANLIFDAREYYPLQNEERFLWRLLEKPDRIRVCKQYLKACAHVLTVSPGLAKRYAHEFGTSCTVFKSVPNFVDIAPGTIEKNKFRLVHHGIANPNRQLEKMIDVVRLLDDRFSFDLYLTGTASYIEYLKEYAKDLQNVRVCKPVPFDDLNNMLTSGYDIGFFYNDPLTFNLRHSLPNKLFEFIQARLAVAIGPSPDMAEVVNKYRCGVVASAFSVQEMANALQALSKTDIELMKANANLAAQELNYEIESIVFLNMIN